LNKFVFHPTYLSYINTEAPESIETARVGNAMLEFFETEIFSSKEFKVSHNLLMPVQESITSLLLPISEEINQFSLPFDPSYVLFPINFYYEQIYNTSLEYEPISQPPLPDLVACFLRFWQLLEQSRSPYMEVHVSFYARCTTLMKVFLLSEDLFLEPVVRVPLEAIFRELTSDKSRFDFSAMAGPKFFGLLEDLVAQFAAVSFGDPLFSSVLFVFLPMEFPFKVRKLIWTELAAMLALLESAVVPFPLGGVHNYLFPTETNSEILDIYVNALIQENVSFGRSPSLYWIAIHHVSSHIFFGDGKSSWTKIQMLHKVITDSPSKETYVDLIFYEYEVGQAQFVKPSVNSFWSALTEPKKAILQETVAKFGNVKERIALDFPE